VVGEAVGLDLLDDLVLGTPGLEPAEAGDFQQHGLVPPAASARRYHRRREASRGAGRSAGPRLGTLPQPLGLGLRRPTEPLVGGGAVASLLGHASERAPRPAGELSFPELLGDPDRLAQGVLGLVEPPELAEHDAPFGERIAELTTVTRDLTFRYRSPGTWIDYWRRYYGPTLKAFEAVGEEGRAVLERDLHELIARFNRADDGTMVVPNAYLEAVIVTR